MQMACGGEVQTIGVKKRPKICKKNVKNVTKNVTKNLKKKRF